MTEIKILTAYRSEEFDELLSKCIQSAIKLEVNRILDSPRESTKAFLTRAEVAKELNVSLPTLNAWEKANILIPVRMGTRVRYRAEDIRSAFAQSKK